MGLDCEQFFFWIKICEKRIKIQGEIFEWGKICFWRELLLNWFHCNWLLSCLPWCPDVWEIKWNELANVSTLHQQDAEAVLQVLVYHISLWLNHELMGLSQGIVKQEGNKRTVLSLNPSAQKAAASLLDFAFQLQLPVSMFVHSLLVNSEALHSVWGGKCCLFVLRHCTVYDYEVANAACSF